MRDIGLEKLSVGLDSEDVQFNNTQLSLRFADISATGATQIAMWRLDTTASNFASYLAAWRSA